MATTTINVFPVETLKAMTEDEIAKLAVSAATIEKDAKDGLKAQQGAFTAIGKLVHNLSVRLCALQAAGKIARSITIEKYWDFLTKNPLSKTAKKCADAVGMFLETGLVNEPAFDKNTYQSLTCAVDIAEAVGGDVAHNAVVSAAAELATPGKETLKKLRSILDTVKERKPWTSEKAQAAVSEILSDGHLTLVVAACGAAFAYAEPDETGQEAFAAVTVAIGMFEKNTKIPAETLATWRGTPAPAAAVTKAPETIEEIDALICALFEKLTALDAKSAALCAAGNMDAISAQHPDAVEAAMGATPKQGVETLVNAAEAEAAAK